ncbi:MAG: pyruvate/2-oxoglutarate dehydrogenase complex dihydrolipoamide dehydrogenase (E3) component [Candidatus Azotimanducaceae bacterium]|jgi:pyruvate/2-oxoglutarate dehydrogenase complex dihydrolipoamide dehydrogenase (E3) component/uncharacterized membrane protein YdjX (TVP38/TMEM64 family)
MKSEKSATTNGAKHYDIVVLGAGSGGLTSAVGFSKVGKKVLMIEREHIGGECTNTGCIPSKALLHHAKSYHAAKTIAGESTQNEEYRKSAFTYVRERVDSILEEETPDVFEKMGIDVIMGEAVFDSKCAVRVNETLYTYNRAIIATGSSPRVVDVDGLNQKDVLTNQNIFNLEDVPERLLIIGSGAIGMEMGQAFAMLGCKVTIASIDARFAKHEDPAISPIIQGASERLGMTVALNATIHHVENKQAIFDISDANGNVVEQKRVAYDKILLAIGRIPNLPQGLDGASIESEKYGIVVDSQYRTTNRYVYALGDVAQRLKFTHTADDAARQVVTRIASKGFLRVNQEKAIPKVTYTQPEIAAVGMSFEEACRKYDSQEVMRIEVPYSANDRAKTDNNTDGLMIVIARRINGAVLGANIVGPTSGEMIAVFTIAIDKKISMWSLRSVMFAYPTYSLLIKKAGDYFFAQQIADLKGDVITLVKKHVPKIFALIFWSILLYSFVNYRASHDMSNLELLGMLFDFVTSSAWGALAYILVYAIRPLIFFPATLLTFLSGALFGFWWGVLFTIIGENMSANFAYWIGRFFGKDVKLEDSFIGNWVSALRKRPFESVLFMRLFYVPFDLTNYGSGILRVKWRSYFLATLIGIMPGLTVFVSLGAAFEGNIRDFSIAFDAFDPFFLALSVGLFIGSIILSRVVKHWKKTAD